MPARAVAAERVEKTCCEKKAQDAEEGRGCHSDGQEGKDCCGDNGCHPLATQCPSCAALAVLPRSGDGLNVGFNSGFETNRYPVLDVAVAGSYLAEMLRPPEVF